MRLVSYENAINAISCLPGIGRKGASKIAQALIEDPSLRDDLINSVDALSIIHQCEICGCLTENEGECEICISSNRDRSVICVVYTNADLMAIEEAGYNGIYHVMDKLIDPNQSISIADTNIAKLIERIDDVNEIIIALPHSHEGSQTAIAIKLVIDAYLLNVSTEKEISITRNATGIASDQSLSFASSDSVNDSIRNRTKLK